MRFVLALVLAMSTAALTRTPAFAENIMVCKQYVDEALFGAGQVRKLACLDESGLKNDRWAGGVDADQMHLRWCETHTPEEVANERAERGGFLDHCGFCRTYAHNAFLAAKFNVDHKCGYETDNPERWNTDEQAHFDWCMGLSSITTYIVGFIIAARDP